MKRLTAIICLLSALFLSFPALAQDPVEPVDPVDPDALEGDVSAHAAVGGRLNFGRQLTTTFRVGDFYVRPGMGFGSGAESTVTAQDEQGVGLRARLFVDAGPSLDVVLPIGTKQRISASGAAFYRWYTNQERLNGWNYLGTAGYEFQGERINFAATYQFDQRYESQLDFIEQGGLAGDIDERTQVQRQTAGARAGFGLGARTNLLARATRIDTQYADGATLDGVDLSEELDRVEDRFNVALQQRLTERTSVGVELDAMQSDYQSNRSFRDDWRMRAGVRADFSGDGRLLGTLAGGYERRRLDVRDREDFSGPYAHGFLRYRAAQRLGVWLRADFRTFPTFFENNVYSISRRLGTGLDYWVHERVNVGAFVDYGEMHYPEPATFEQLDGTFITAKREDTLATYRGTLTVRVWGQSVGLQAGYFERDSNFTAFGSRGYFVRVGLSAIFSRAL